MRPRCWARAVLALGAAAAPLIATSGAFAATDAPGTQNLQLSAGQLSVGQLTPGTLSGVVGGAASGQLPEASFSDTTGSGSGWQGAVAASDFIYTGAWQASSGSPALASSSAGSWAGTADGITITVKVGTGGTSSSTPFSWSDTAGNSGTGTATNGAPAAIEDGVTIDFAAGTAYANGDQYSVHVGAQGAQALSLNSAQGTITPAAGVQSPAPVFVNSGAAVVGGGASYGAAVPMVSAAVNEGMGTYAVAPGAQVVTDASSWAATYVAQVQYTIATGPSSAPAQVRVGAVATAAFSYTGSLQTYTVPAGDYWLQVQATGGAGGNNNSSPLVAGGLGAQVSAYLPVTPGQTVYVLVAGAGEPPGGGGPGTGGPGGYGGGGGGGTSTGNAGGGGGGGASAIFIGGTSSTDLALVAGGGGGASYTQVGGNGGTPSGAAGGGSYGGGGGTQSAGGAGGTSNSADGSPGTAFSLTAASGGAGGTTAAGGGGGGGGGGYFGGGGGGGSSLAAAGAGGGGSSWVESGAQQVTYSLAATAGNGSVTLQALASLP